MSIPNVLLSYDLPGLLASLACPRFRFLALWPIDAMTVALNSSAASEAFATPKRAFRAA
jgi:hypothetical protein